MLNFWKFTSYCSLKPLWLGMGEVVPARTSPTLHPPSPPTAHQLSRLALSELINIKICSNQIHLTIPHLYQLWFHSATSGAPHPLGCPPAGTPHWSVECWQTPRLCHHTTVSIVPEAKDHKNGFRRLVILFCRRKQTYSPLVSTCFITLQHHDLPQYFPFHYLLIWLFLLNNHTFISVDIHIQ